MNKTTPTVPLEQLCDSERGITYGIVKVGDFVPGGVPVIRGGDIRNNQIVFDDQKRVTEEVSNRFRRTILKGGEVLINLIAEPGHVAIVPNNLAGSNVSRDVAVIPLNDSVNHRFVCYFLKSPQCVQWLTSRLQGSVTQKINLNTLREVPVPVPPLPEQKAIARILSSLDDKIELNQQMNRTLEAIARAIFKSWFVDFDPVRAKMDSRQPAGMDAATADLFPDSFEDSPRGKIPKGWTVEQIRSRATAIQYGLTQSASSNPVGPNFLRITDIQGGVVDWSKVPFCQASPEEHKRYRIQEGDIFVARTGASTGENIYIVDAPDAVFASYLVRFQFAELYTARVVGAFMRTASYFDYVAGAIGGSAQPNASAQVLAGASLVFPSPNIAQSFYETVRPLDITIAANQRQSLTLATIRDTLLPKLMSGEIRVKDSEKLIEDIRSQHHHSSNELSFQS